jgi:glycosyltransferase involved in cell wall biosynthesis
MRITFVLERADMSGGVRVVAEHARELIRRGHDCRVVSTPWPKRSLRGRIKDVVLRPQINRASHLDNSGVPHQCVESINDANLPNADAVIATWWRTAESVAALSPAKGVKFHFIQHYETWVGEEARVDAVWRLPLHRIVISRWLKELAQSKFGDRDVSLVLNGVDHRQFNAPARDKQPVPTVGMLYSTTPFKGCDIALAAFELVKRSIPNAKLIAFGIGPVSAQLPLPPDCQYHQNPPQNELAGIYAKCDVWLCGSRTEGFHLPPLEAMACRCPVVSTPVGGPADIITDGADGFLAADSAALAAHTIAVLQLSDPVWRNLSDAAYATAGRYSWQVAGEALDSILKDRAGPCRNNGAGPCRPGTSAHK